MFFIFDDSSDKLRLNKSFDDTIKKSESCYNKIDILEALLKRLPFIDSLSIYDSENKVVFSVSDFILKNFDFYTSFNKGICILLKRNNNSSSDYIKIVENKKEIVKKNTKNENIINKSINDIIGQILSYDEIFTKYETVYIYDNKDKKAENIKLLFDFVDNIIDIDTIKFIFEQNKNIRLRG